MIDNIMKELLKSISKEVYKLYYQVFPLTHATDGDPLNQLLQIQSRVKLLQDTIKTLIKDIRKGKSGLIIHQDLLELEKLLNE